MRTTSRRALACAASLLLLASAAHAVPPAFTGQPILADIQEGSFFLVNLRAQGVVSGTAPLLVTPGEVFIDGEPNSAIGIQAYSSGSSVCLRIEDEGFNGDAGTVQVQLTATNGIGESVGPTLVSIALQPGPVVDEGDAAQLSACLDPNQPPSANAGADRIVADTDGQDGEDVVLDASGSSDPDGTISSYVWSEGGTTIATGATATVRLADGVHVLTLTVQDDAPSANSAQDTVTITVGAAPQGPSVTIQGGDRNIPDSDGQPGERVTLSATASDPNGSVVSYQWFDEQENVLGEQAQITVDLPDGVQQISVVVLDDSGNSAFASVTLNVGAAPARTVLEQIPGLSENQRSIARVLDGLCQRLAERAADEGLSSDESDLLSRCNGIATGSSVAEQTQALRELGAQDLNAMRTQVQMFAGQQHSGVMDRMIALRSGARGLSVAGLALSVDGRSVPLAQLGQLLRGLTGGSAGEDEEPGALFGDRLGLWLRGNYSFGDKAASAADAGFDADEWGMTGGVDYRYTENTVFGIAAGYGKSNLSFGPSGDGDGDDGGLDTRSWALSVYGSMYAAGSFYVDGVLNYARVGYDANRRIRYLEGGELVDRNARGATDGQTLSAGMSVGYDHAWGPFTLSPNAGYVYTDTSIDAFREHGAMGLDLRYDERSFRSATAHAGLRLTYAWKLPFGVVLPHVRSDYVHEFQDDVETFGVRFANDPFAQASDRSAPIVVRSDVPDRSYWRLAAGASAQFAYGISAYAEYQRYESFQYLRLEKVTLGLRVQRSLR